jgi:phage terminase small subunit
MEAFCQNCAAGKSHRQAAILAGYSQKTAASIGAQLARQPRVEQRIRELRELAPTLRVISTRESVIGRITEATKFLQALNVRAELTAA